MRNPSFAACAVARTPAPAASRGFTLVEVLLSVTVLVMFFALASPVLTAARKSSARASCRSNLRQLGMAFQMYVQDNGVYPASWEVTHGGLLRDKSILACPQDTEMVLMGASSSYHFKSWLPPSFEPLAGQQSVPAGVVLAACEHHLGQKTIALKDDSTATTPAEFPFRLALRADGSVQQVHMDSVRYLPLPGKHGAFLETYPGEPGYEKALKR
jgi:prepilin-type N-terminal cleavage/methylation domain-containing protein